MAVATLEQSSPADSLKDYPQGAKGDRNALVGMQRVLWRKVNDPKTPAHIAAQCARAWRDLQDMKRIMDGKPLPGQLRPDLAQQKQSKRKGPSLLPLPEVPAAAENSPKESLS
jgi:hypothetical protein